MTQQTLNREIKIRLLEAMKRGYFTEDDRKELEPLLKGNNFVIEVIHCKECLTCSHKAETEQMFEETQKQNIYKH